MEIAQVSFDAAARHVATRDAFVILKVSPLFTCGTPEHYSLPALRSRDSMLRERLILISLRNGSYRF